MDAGEFALWTAYRADRSIDRRNALVERYMPLLINIAEKVHDRCGGRVEVGDLIGSGSIGLMQAVEAFDVDRGNKFTTFANPRIWGAMMDGIREMDHVPRLERMREKSGAVVKEIVSLDRMAGWAAEGEGTPVVGEPSCLAVHDEPKTDDFWVEVCRGLNKTERLIVMLYFRERLTIREVGRQIGVSESRVSQQMTAIQNRIRKRRGLVEDLQQLMPPKPWRSTWEIVRRIKADEGFYEYEPPQKRTTFAERSGVEPLVGLTMADVERKMIMATLAAHGGNRDRTAKQLGICIRKLSDRLREYGVPRRWKPETGAAVV
jgi:RNA polymerase sigma factor for flagellar operon FliA